VYTENKTITRYLAYVWFASFHHSILNFNSLNLKFREPHSSLACLG